ncbi:hypothetical protein BDV93DRAFT_565750, partial [Ceratobasidium sp. AG-I]
FITTDGKASWALEPNGGSDIGGTDVVFSHPSSSSSQVWTIIHPPNVQQLIPRYQGPYDTRATVRFKHAKEDISFDWVEEQLLFHLWSSYHRTNQEWELEPGNSGYRIRHPVTKRCVIAGTDGILTLSEPDVIGKEFLFDGNQDDGYYIMDSDDTAFAIEAQGGKTGNGVGLVRNRGRRDKWIVEGF